MTTDPQAALEALAKVLESLDIDIEDLARHLDGETATHTTVADYLPTARAAASPACREKYDHYWRLLSEGDSRCPCTCEACVDTRRVDECGCGNEGHGFESARRGLEEGATYPGIGDKPVAKVSTADIEVAAGWAQALAMKRNTARARKRDLGGRHPRHDDGRSAKESLIRAARNFLATACGDPDVRVSVNVARDVAIPKRRATEARHLDADQLAELWEATLSGGDDPELDALLFWGQLELGARRSGLLNLTVAELNDLYRREPALHCVDDSADGFSFVVGDDDENSVVAFLRHAPDERSVLVVCNFRPELHSDYRIGVPDAGRWVEIAVTCENLYFFDRADHSSIQNPA